MQSVSPQFALNSAAGQRRKIKSRVAISFLKTYSPGATFFTIGTSTIGGPDIIKGTGGVVQEWDKYNYDDFSKRVIDIEYDREFSLDPNVPVILGMADITLDNSDDYFTLSNPNSPLAGFVLPQRPIKIYMGFDNELIQVFAGVTDGMPTFDETAKTVKFHCIDFLYTLLNTPLDNDVIIVNQRTDQLVGALLQFAGMSAAQYIADVGSVTIPFFYAAKGAVLSNSIRDIVQAELGRLYMDENGMITFENRTNWQTGHNAIVGTINRRNSLSFETPVSDNIINVVTVTSNARAVQAKQKLWEQTSAQLVPAGSSLDIIADMSDSDGTLPVTSFDTPAYITSATTSLFATNTAQDNSGSVVTAGISVAVTPFSTSYKMTFTNTNIFDVYLTQIEVWGTPAKVTNRLYIRAENTASTSIYDEKLADITNDYIQDNGAANSIAQIIIGDLATLNATRKGKIVGLPQLQIADRVTFQDQVVTRQTFVTRINGIFNLTDGFVQNVTHVERAITPYFKIGVSSIGGSDKIAP